MESKDVKAFFSHVSPVGASLTIWLIRIVLLAFNIAPATTAAKRLDTTMWALTSLMASSCWRLFADEKTLFGGKSAGWESAVGVRVLEAIACTFVFLTMLVANGAAAAGFVARWMAAFTYATYLFAVAYVVVGFLACNASTIWPRKRVTAAVSP